MLDGEFLVVFVADDDGAAAAGDDCLQRQYTCLPGRGVLKKRGTEEGREKERTLLVGVQRLGEDGVAGEDHDDGKVLVHERQHAVLELAGHDGLAVQVGDLLDLERALERGRVLAAAAQEQQALLALEELVAQGLDGLVELKDVLELFGDVGQAVHEVFAALLLRGAVLAEREGKHDHGDELGGVGLRGGDADLGTGVDVHTTVGEEGDGGADHVDNPDRQGAALQAVPQSHQRVCSLAGLRDEDAGVVTENGRLSVQEVRSQLDGDGDFGELFKGSPNRHARVKAGTAGDEDQTPAAADGAHVLLQTTKRDGLVLDVETTTHGVDDGLGLLEDFLLHEVVKFALHNFLKLELERLDGSDVGSSIVLGDTVNVQSAIVNVGDVVVLEVQDLLGVFDDGGGIRRQEELGRHRDAIVREEGPGLGAVEQGLIRRLEQSSSQRGAQSSAGRSPLHRQRLRRLLGRKNALAGVFYVDKIHLHLLLGLDANHQRRTLAGSNEFMRIVDGFHQKAKGTLELLDDGLGEDGELDVGMSVVDVFGELGNAFGVCSGLELETLAFEQCLQFFVVGNDTIVNDGELPRRVRSAHLSVLL